MRSYRYAEEHQRIERDCARRFPARSVFGEAIFVFCNRNRDRLKILEWDGDGFWLYFKRLEKGRFRWPKTGDEPTMTLNSEDLRILLGGARVEQKLKRDEVFERKIV